MSLTNQEINGLGDSLWARRKLVLAQWGQAVAQTLRGRLTSEELGREQTEVLSYITDGLRKAGSDFPHEAYEPLRETLTALSSRRARQGFTPSETAISIFALKEAWLGIVGQEGEALADYVAFSRLLDQIGLFTFEAYAHAREKVISEQAQQLLELSTPVVKIWDGVLVVPLVGTLDSARAQLVTEQLLQQLVEAGADHTIIDITGVPTVDTRVAQHLLKTVRAARLMGAECIVSGIRPQIAQIIVELGIDFNDIRTKATLADALRLCIRQRGQQLPEAGED